MSKSKAQLQAELLALKAQLRANNISRVLRDLFKHGGYVGIAFFVYKSIEALSGKVTLTDFNIKVDGDILNMECKTAINIGLVVGAVGFSVGLLGFLFGSFQRGLRLKVIEEKAKRIRELELKIDPSRSSCGLTEKGETRKEDK